MKIAIVGGGFTGLTAAYELSNLGHEVTIYEKNSELGGLASGFLMHGENLEKTYHHIFKTDIDIISLVERLGLGAKLEWRDSSVCIYYDKKLYPFGGALDLLKFSPLSFFSRIRLGLVILFLQKYKNWEKLKGISA
ncbi:MAG: FAD-dependent oxidoreductase, partial [Bacteroidales bacterium]